MPSFVIWRVLFDFAERESLSIWFFLKISRQNRLISIASCTIRLLYFRQVAADAAAKVLSNGDNIPKILDGLNLEKDEAMAPPSTPTREGDVEKDVST